MIQQNQDQEINKSQEKKDKKSTFTQVFDYCSLFVEFVVLCLQGYEVYQMYYNENKCKNFEQFRHCYKADEEKDRVTYYATKELSCEEVQQGNCKTLDETFFLIISPFNTSELKRDIIICAIVIQVLTQITIKCCKLKMSLRRFTIINSLLIISRNIINEACFFQTQADCTGQCGTYGFNESLEYAVWPFMVGAFFLFCTVMGPCFALCVQAGCNNYCSCCMNAQRNQNIEKSKKLMVLYYLFVSAMAFDVSGFIVLKSTKTIFSQTIPSLILLIVSIIWSFKIPYDIYKYNSALNKKQKEQQLLQQQPRDGSQQQGFDVSIN